MRSSVGYAWQRRRKQLGNEETKQKEDETDETCFTTDHQY
jgi:hypothetical protein